MSKWPPRPAQVKTKRQSQHRRRTSPNPHSFLTVIPTVIVTRYFEIHSVLFVNTVNFVNILCSQHIIDLLCQNTPVISNQSPSLFEMFPLHPKIFIRDGHSTSRNYKLHSQCENNNDNELTGPVTTFVQGDRKILCQCTLLSNFQGWANNGLMVAGNITRGME